MDYQEILCYVIKILIVLAQTSDMSPVMKQTRIDRLTYIMKEVDSL